MRPTTLALIVTGIALVLAGGVTSFLVPLRTETDGYNTPGGGWSEETYRKTLWGRLTHYRQHVTNSSPDQKPHGEGVRAIADEWIFEGDINWDGERHGRWIMRERNGTSWTERSRWYLHDLEVSQDVWETR